MRRGSIFDGVLRTAGSYFVTNNDWHTFSSYIFISRQIYEQRTFLSLHLWCTNPLQNPCSKARKMPATTLTTSKLAV